MIWGVSFSEVNHSYFSIVTVKGNVQLITDWWHKEFLEYTGNNCLPKRKLEKKNIIFVNKSICNIIFLNEGIKICNFFFYPPFRINGKYCECINKSHCNFKKTNLFFLLFRSLCAHRKSALSLPRDISEDRDGKLQYRMSIDWSKSKIFFSIHVWSNRFRSGMLDTNKMAALEENTKKCVTIYLNTHFTICWQCKALSSNTVLKNSVCWYIHFKMRCWDKWWT